MMFTRKGRQGQGQGQRGGVDAKKSGAGEGGGGGREGGRYDANAVAAAAGGSAVAATAAAHTIELMGKVPGQVMDAKKPQPLFMTKGQIIKQGNLQPPYPPHHP